MGVLMRTGSTSLDVYALHRCVNCDHLCTHFCHGGADGPATGCNCPGFLGPEELGPAIDQLVAFYGHSRCGGWTEQDGLVTCACGADVLTYRPCHKAAS